MRSLKKQCQPVWFTKITEESDDDGELIKIYSKPVKYSMSVSATAGTPEELAAGIVPNYDRYITSHNRDLKPAEGDMVFVDVIPQTDQDGNLVMKEDGITPVTVPDYKIEKILDTQRGTVARYGIKKINES